MAPLMQRLEQHAKGIECTESVKTCIAKNVSASDICLTID